MPSSSTGEGGTGGSVGSVTGGMVTSPGSVAVGGSVVVVVVPPPFPVEEGGVSDVVTKDAVLSSLVPSPVVSAVSLWAVVVT